MIANPNWHRSTRDRSYATRQFRFDTRDEEAAIHLALDGASPPLGGGARFKRFALEGVTPFSYLGLPLVETAFSETCHDATLRSLRTSVTTL